MADLLKYRFCDIHEPTITDVHRFLANPRMLTFYVSIPHPHRTGHTTPDPTHNGIQGEFTIENRTGRAWQIHFSVSPDNPGPTFNIALARSAAYAVLNLWDPRLRPLTLFGVTPRSNRAACIFVLKTGYLKIGVLPNGIETCYREDTIDDALLTILTPERTHGWKQKRSQ
jgi:hypothetical protein